MNLAAKRRPQLKQLLGRCYENLVSNGMLQFMANFHAELCVWAQTNFGACGFQARSNGPTRSTPGHRPESLQMITIQRALLQQVVR